MDVTRFEYRIFGPSLIQEQHRMAALSDPVPAELHRRISHEYYLIPRHENRFNVKIRDGKLDIKYLLQTVDGFERWQPRIKIDFPLNKSDMRREAFTALDVDLQTDSQETFSMRQFIDLLKSEDYVRVVKVKKMRRAYTVKNVICEFASLNLEKIRTTTISAESNDLTRLKKVVEELGISKFQNTNYIRAIRQIAGMK
jgi:hypothetical protein